MYRRIITVVIAIAVCCLGGCEGGRSTIPPAPEQAGDRGQQAAAPLPPAVQSPKISPNFSGGPLETSSGSPQQEYVSFPTAGIKLIRPAGFDAAENFEGFQQPSTQSSVMVTMLPGPYSETTRGFTAEQLKPLGMNLRSKEVVEIAGHSGLILDITQTANGTEYGKWVAAFGREAKTIMVTASYPLSEEANLSESLKAVVLSAKMDKTTATTSVDEAGFSIDEAADLKPAKGLGKLLMYTKDGVVPTKSPEDPVFIAAKSMSKVRFPDKRDAAIKRLYQTANTKVISILSTTEISTDGLNGYEIIADAESTDSGTAIKIYQVILFDENSYILMQGLVGVTAADIYLPEFKSMARSLKQNSN